jgi:acetoin utilization protein AcuB
MSVSRIMTTEVVSLSPRDRVRHALSAIYENDIRQLPVVDEDGVIIGIVTDRDVREHIGAHLGIEGDPESRRDALNDRVVDVMTAEPATIDPAASIGELIDMLIETKYGGLPVVDDEGHVVGIVTYIDVLRELRDQAD